MTNKQAPARWQAALSLCLTFWLASAALSAAAQSQQAWPTRPVKIVVPYSAGGTADNLGRLTADHRAQAAVHRRQQGWCRGHARLHAGRQGRA